MQGKVRPFNLFLRALVGLGQGFEETLRNLPARIAATNLRNYCLGHKVRYKFFLVNNSLTADYAITVRQILHALGTISYKDSWGAVYDSMDVDRIYAGNLADRMWGPGKLPLNFEMLVKKQSRAEGLFEVVLPYAPAFFSPVRRAGSFFDGMFACSMLGEEASIRFGAVGAPVNADVEVRDVAIKLDSVCCQTKELVAPMPIEFRDDLLPPTTNPYISTGDVRKLNHLFVLSEAIGTALAPVMLNGVDSLNEILIDLDGHVAYQGQCETLTRDTENYGGGAPFAMNGLLNWGGGGGAIQAMAQSLYYGEMYALIDPCAWEKASQAQACKRLELRGIGPMEQQNVLIMSERRYEEPSAHFERWADREGLSREERKDIRIGGMNAQASKLRRSEAVGVPQVVSSRKERKE